MTTGPTLYASWHEAGIDITGLRADRTGQARATCPECTPNRKPEHRREKDLSVNLTDQTWFCHHCSWAGRIADHPSASGMGEQPRSPNARRSTRNPVRSLDDPGPALETYLDQWLQEERGLSRNTADTFRVFPLLSGHLGTTKRTTR